MPYCDLLDRVYQTRVSGDDRRAYDLFAALLPMMSFTLQDFELFLQVERRILVRRGLFTSATVRHLTFAPSAAVLQHVEFLMQHLFRILEHAGVEPIT